MTEVYPLHDAIRAKQHGRLRSLLLGMKDADINTQEPIHLMTGERGEPTSDPGDTALQLAVRENNMTAARILVADARVDPETKDFFGDTPLHTACELRRTAMVRLLMCAYWERIKLPDPATLRGREVLTGLKCDWHTDISSGQPILELIERHKRRDEKLKAELVAEFSL